MNIDRLFPVAIVIAVCFLAFLYGFVSHRADLFPSRFINAAIDQGTGAMQRARRPGHLFPIVYEPPGANVIDEAAIQPGLTLITTFFPELDWRPGVRLIDQSGNVLHVWDTDPEKIWPERKSQFASKELTYVHGIHLYPDGDIVFNIDYEGLVRMDACSNVKWKTEQKTHHSLSQDENGNFWASAFVMQTDQAYIDQYPGLLAPVVEEHALLITPQGEVIKDINLLETVYANGFQRYLTKTSKRQKNDILHLNDIEPLSSAMADEYPLFSAGDIVVSLKFFDLVMVMSPDTGKVKWHEADQLNHQHDPDFIGDGWIGVFDNNVDFTDRGTMLGGSRIIAFKPDSGESKIIYPTDSASPFYTRQGGKWQLLENGNALIAEAQAGRIFEATPSGKIVWEWIHEPDSNDLVPEVFEGTRYDIDPQTVAQWECSRVSE